MYTDEDVEAMTWAAWAAQHPNGVMAGDAPSSVEATKYRRSVQAMLAVLKKRHPLTYEDGIEAAAKIAIDHAECWKNLRPEMDPISSAVLTGHADGAKKVAHAIRALSKSKGYPTSEVEPHQNAPVLKSCTKVDRSTP